MHNLPCRMHTMDTCISKPDLVKLKAIKSHQSINRLEDKLAKDGSLHKQNKFVSHHNLSEAVENIMYEYQNIFGNNF